jgi:hypothetical protein
VLVVLASGGTTMLCCDFRRVVAVALVLTTTFITMPVSAADFSSTRSVLGSVSSVGPVELRGVSISTEGTLFSGDSIRSRDKGYAKVLLGSGSKIELSEKTELNVNSDAQGVKIAMNAGTMGFTSLGSAVRVSVQPFDIVTSTDAAGSVAVGNNSASVRALKGSVTVRNRKTAESFVLLKGQDRLFGLDGTNKGSLGEIASTVPGPLPTLPPQVPAGRTSGGLAMDAGAWVAVIAGAAVAGLAITGVIIALNNRDDLKDIKAQNANLLAQTQQSNAAGLAALARARALSDAAFTARLNALAIASTAGQANVAAQTAPNLTAAQRTTFGTRAQTLNAQANTSAQTIAGLISEITALEAAIAAAGTPTGGQTTQLNSLRDRLNTEIGNLNNIRNQETQLITDMRNAGILLVQTSQPTPTVASASIPT